MNGIDDCPYNKNTTITELLDWREAFPSLLNNFALKINPPAFQGSCMAHTDTQLLFMILTFMSTENR